MSEGPGQPPPDQVPPRRMSRWKKGCLGCGGTALGIFVLLVIIGAIVGPPKKTGKASHKPPSSPSASTFSRAVTYLYEVDHHQHSQAEDATLLAGLAQHCTDDPLLLSATASNTALDIKLPEGKVQDVYGVLSQLKKDTSRSSKGVCAKKLAAVPTELTPSAPASSASPSSKLPEEQDGAPASAPAPGSAPASPAATAHSRTPEHPLAASASHDSSAVILSPSGRYYRAGQFCPAADAGMSTQDAHGNTITCVMESGRYHWHY
ncbi:hypothetical protein Q3V23_00135 [Streptomyces sp. VNUA116]|uniref:hypothetical protein n=1 Tax=Streptomyces sp. VNUA116 TaxID=3062449 RepID=UPI00267650AC|nr:hypothetical protein [Streptomyces sp. VNUA116]WKU42607.1 hypothetical protein Q3V23_00135 [Streptomyces sp. VNUA116]